MILCIEDCGVSHYSLLCCSVYVLLPAGLCYGKPEAAGLALLLPLLCLSHLGGAMLLVV